MKKYIRDILNDLKNRDKNDYVPRIPKAPQDAEVTDYDPKQAPVMPSDLDNQELSEDPLERARQLDWQAQQKVQNPVH